ncbi:MAG: CDGSH iron-sulfur domain-containing protein [Candidatus Omnitrophica bacterium]|nr:CDGSH iron-sulfur domain-containing protein [Candidatus Omnitrophota bacterium]
MAKQNAPYVMDMKPGEYWWCACGESSNPPFCDGTHKTRSPGTSPVLAVIDQPRKVAWCGCRASGKKPFCDGTHAKMGPPR